MSAVIALNCIKCKSQIPGNSMFCLHCGVKQKISPSESSIKTRNAAGKSRGNGTGSVYKMPNGKWRAEVTLGYDSETKKRVNKIKSGLKTKREALEYLTILKSNTKVEKTITINEAYKHITPKLEKLSESRQSMYKSAYKHLKSIEFRSLDSLSLADLQGVIDKIDGGFYSKRYVKDLLSKLFNYAFADGKIDRNIVPYIELPKNEPVKEKAIFTDEEVDILWDSWNAGEEFAGYILILLHCAIRTGELRSIKSKSVDYEKSVMYGGIKTKRGKFAPIFIIPKIEPVVRHFAEKYPDGVLYNGHDVKFYREWRVFKDKIGLREELDPYSGRHSCATILAKAGIPEAVILAIMRHEKYDTTLEYTHIDVKSTLSHLESAFKSTVDKLKYM